MARFLSDPAILTLTRLNISAPSCNEALYPPMIVAVGLLGPLPRSDNPLQATYTLEHVPHINDVLPKMLLDICQFSQYEFFLYLCDTIQACYHWQGQAHMYMWP